jgi:hypothetical protein
MSKMNSSNNVTSLVIYFDLASYIELYQNCQYMEASIASAELSVARINERIQALRHTIIDQFERGNIRSIGSSQHTTIRLKDMN